MSDPENHYTAPEVNAGYAVTVTPVRWMAYRKGYTGKKLGRWQAMNSYGGWDNCAAPDKVYESPPKIEEVETDT